MNIIAIDPGIHTGYCYARITEDGKAELYPFEITDEVDDLWRRLVDFKPRHIIIESFEFRQLRQHSKIELFPVQLIGVARLYTLIGPAETAIFVQNPAQGKSYYTDSVLKQNNLYKRGVRHGMDATRHMLQWLTFGP